jgi:hypothetical protein
LSFSDHQFDGSAEASIPLIARTGGSSLLKTGIAPISALMLANSVVASAHRSVGADIEQVNI